MKHCCGCWWHVTETLLQLLTTCNNLVYSYPILATFKCAMPHMPGDHRMATAACSTFPSWRKSHHSLPQLAALPWKHVIQKVPARGSSWEEPEAGENSYAAFLFWEGRYSWLHPSAMRDSTCQGVTSLVPVLKYGSQPADLSWSWVNKARKSCVISPSPSSERQEVIAEWTPVGQGAHKSTGDPD